MTDKELDELKGIVKAVIPGQDYKEKGYREYYDKLTPEAMLELIADVQQARKERDWLAYKLEDSLACCSLDKNNYCDIYDCISCKYIDKEEWLKTAKEATK